MKKQKPIKKPAKKKRLKQEFEFDPELLLQIDSDMFISSLIKHFEKYVEMDRDEFKIFLAKAKV